MNYNIFLFGIITIMFTTILYNTAMAENEIPQWIKTGSKLEFVIMIGFTSKLSLD